MASAFTFDAPAFQRGLRHKLSLTRRAAADVMNGAGRDVCLHSIKATPKANPAAIKAKLASNGTAFRILQSPATQSRLPKRLRGFTKGTHTRAQINAAAAALIAARRRSSGYIKAGWIKAAQAFSGAPSARVSSRGLASKGFGRRATANALAIEGANLARGAGSVGLPALQQALTVVGEKMQTYAPKKLAAPWR